MNTYQVLELKKCVRPPKKKLKIHHWGFIKTYDLLVIDANVGIL